MGKIVGIDLGTTNSVVAVLEGGESSVIAKIDKRCQHICGCRCQRLHRNIHIRCGCEQEELIHVESKGETIRSCIVGVIVFALQATRYKGSWCCHIVMQHTRRYDNPDISGVCSRDVYFGDVERLQMDLRLAEGLDPTQHFTQQKQVTLLNADESESLNLVRSDRN